MTEIYKKLGLLLDQTQPGNLVKANGANLIYDNILSQMEKTDCFTQKYGLTLTFKKSFHLDDPLYLHKTTDKFMSKYKNEFKYIGFPEFTKKNHNLHYHFIIWDCYELPLVTFSKRWQRKFGISKLENPIKHYYCKNKESCRIKHLLLKPKEDSKCWFHYIIKDYGINGLWSLTNY